MPTLHQFIDHTLLKPEATEAQIQKLCQQAIEHRFFGVCVNSSWVPTAADLLKYSDVSVVSVIGFPLGVNSVENRVHEIRWAVNAGADELDILFPIAQLRSFGPEKALQELKTLISTAPEHLVKVIFETHLLSKDEKILACKLSAEAGARSVKTSTGFTGGGATLEDVSLMKAHIPSNMFVKASGGIRSQEDALKMVAAGATRLGTSSGVQIVTANTKPASPESY